VTLPEVQGEKSEYFDDLVIRQKSFGYTYEDIHKYLVPVITEGKDPLGSMGNDTPLAVLSDLPQSLFNYFKQLFAQVTNPPIDAIREQLVTSTMTLLGAEGNLLHPTKENIHRIQLETPVLTNDQTDQLKSAIHPDFKSAVISAVFTNDLKADLDRVFAEAEAAINAGASILVLTDREAGAQSVAIPALLAVSGLHQHLVRKGNRTKASIVVETGEAREVHHFAALIGYGADAINPYLTFATYQNEINAGTLNVSYDYAVEKYVKAVTEGVVKVMSKMGISTVQSYRGAQIFEAVGISAEVIEQYFTGTASQLGGIGLDVIAKEAKTRHDNAYVETIEQTLESGSDFQWRHTGEHHAFNPKTIHTLQWAC
ncbi:glutamate synthase central domain-containing protein, partial [Priestia megaterium]